MDGLSAAGLGLEYGTVRLERTTDEWLVAGARLRNEVARSLGPLAADVEQIGSSSVIGLLAKPVIDLAVGVSDDVVLPPVTKALEAAGWIYRGDAGDDGGHVFVLEDRPRHRVAHLHVVEHHGAQWRNYLSFRDLLRADSAACARYEAVKLRLAAEHKDGGGAYTEGKTDVVRSLLDSTGS